MLPLALFNVVNLSFVHTRHDYSSIPILRDHPSGQVKGGLSKEVVSDEGEFSIGHIAPEGPVLQKKCSFMRVVSQTRYYCIRFSFKLEKVIMCHHKLYNLK